MAVDGFRSVSSLALKLPTSEKAELKMREPEKGNDHGRREKAVGITNCRSYAIPWDI